MKKVMVLALIVVLVFAVGLYTNKTGLSEMLSMDETLEKAIGTTENEVKKLEQEDLYSFTESNSNDLPFKIRMEVSPKTQAAETKLFFDIQVFNAKDSMEKVAITALLPEEFHGHLNAPFLWFSNVDAVFDKSAPEDFFTLDKNAEAGRSIAIGRTFLLNSPEFSPQDVASIEKALLKTKIKVTWLDENSNVKTKFVKIHEENLNVMMEDLVE